MKKIVFIIHNGEKIVIGETDENGDAPEIKFSNNVRTMFVFSEDDFYSAVYDKLHPDPIGIVSPKEKKLRYEFLFKHLKELYNSFGKIEAIKFVREFTNWGLRDSKEFVEFWMTA